MTDWNNNREEILIGGSATVVVRVGDTVRRPLKERSSFVHSLLKHLESVGFTAAPKFLGIDEQGREILTYIQGYAGQGRKPFDCGHWSDDQLVAAASLIRKYHDATAGSTLTMGEEVVCHNDLSPVNTVFHTSADGLPFAFFDFDTAAPGLRIRDLGYSAWLWLVLGPTGPVVSEQRRRLQLWCDAYGITDSTAVLDQMEIRQLELLHKYEEDDKNGKPGAKEEISSIQDQINWIRSNRSTLEG
ncbi:aminoglycoside phosphotransferase family protein [Paenibacillus sp. Y412MC10]|uniref:aminoglycoside phosphotransferase family protein n=1 Tax=Geobacillus sp. (strain Y412MC10) TaxID=481743 RepID=UPI001642433A|nr:aminoglycoside phosphotransferase family protein [Paenibacillus sp. Y412MC10]